MTHRRNRSIVTLWNCAGERHRLLAATKVSLCYWRFSDGDPRNAGSVKVSDFGISREMDTRGFAATFTGTAIYMSPERMQGKNYSFPSDIWALGLISTELGIGRYPYILRLVLRAVLVLMSVYVQASGAISAETEIARCAQRSRSGL